MTKLSDVYVSKWLRAVKSGDEGRIALPGEPERITLTISSVDVEEFKGRDNEKNKQFVLNWKEDVAPLGLNKTNADKVAEIAGSTDSDDWRGTRVEVYVIESDFSDSGYALRVRKPKADAPVANGQRSSQHPMAEEATFFGGDWATKTREKLKAISTDARKVTEEMVRQWVMDHHRIELPPILENWPRSAMSLVVKAVDELSIPF